MGLSTEQSRKFHTHFLHLAVATAVIGISIFTIRAGFAGAPQLDPSAPYSTELLSSVHLGDGGLSLDYFADAAVASGWNLQSPPPPAGLLGERFIGEAGARADVETLIPARGNGELDARVHLLEATTQRWVREGRPYDKSRSMCEVFSDRGDWRFVPPRCSRKEQ